MVGRLENSERERTGRLVFQSGKRRHLSFASVTLRLMHVHAMVALEASRTDWSVSLCE